MKKKIRAQGRKYAFEWMEKGYWDRETKMSDRGSCDAPTKKFKTIRIREGLSDKLLMDTACHEFLHASLWMADEDFVTQFGHELADFLYDLGFRRQEDQSIY